MNIIGCLDVADSGVYKLDGQEISSYSERQLSKIRNEKIGFVFQNFNLLPRLTAEANVALPLIYQRVPYTERKKRTREALELVGLADRMTHKPKELSGGQQQRVAIARAIVTKPNILLADEPTGNLDSKTGREIMNLIHDLHHSGATIILITHNDEIAWEADRCVHIMDGQISEV